jgi:hypothetical protein
MRALINLVVGFTSEEKKIALTEIFSRTESALSNFSPDSSSYPKAFTSFRLPIVSSTTAPSLPLASDCFLNREKVFLEIKMNVKEKINELFNQEKKKIYNIF